MKLKCPTCDSKVDIGSASRYDIFTCSCGRRFRGVKAELAAVDFFLRKFFTFGGMTDSYDSASATPCPHCSSSIQLTPNSEYMGVHAPDTCWACGKHLDTSFVK